MPVSSAAPTDQATAAVLPFRIKDTTTTQTAVYSFENNVFRNYIKDLKTHMMEETII